MNEMGDLQEYWARLAARKRELGIVEDTDTLKNSGENRTPAKREMLHRAKARAKEAGVAPIKANF